MITICKDGTTVTVSGNSIVTSRGECYTLMGNCLSGTGGFCSFNVVNINEAVAIVVGLHGGKVL